MTRPADFDDIAPATRAPLRFWLGAAAVALGAGAVVYTMLAGPADTGTRSLLMGTAAVLGGLGLYATCAGRTTTHGAEPDAIQAVTHSLDAYFTTDALGLVLDTNRAARSLISRLSPELGLRRPVAALFAADAEVEAKVYRLMRAALNAGGAEEYFSGPDNTVYHASVSRVGAAGDTILWRIARDAERAEALVLSEPAPAPDDPLSVISFGYYRADRGGVILDMNKALCAMLGMERGDDDAAPQPVTIDEIFGEGGARLSPAVGRIGEELVIGATLRGPRGARKMVEVMQTLVDTGEGGATAHGFVFPARSERMQSEPGGSRLTRIFNSAPVATAVLDLGGTIAEVNDLIVDMSGGSARPGAPITVSVKLEERASLEKLLSAAASGVRMDKPSTFTLTDAEGKERIAQLFVSRAVLEGGAALVLFLVDVTDQIALEHRMAQTQKMQAIGQLSGNLAHDFNNILTVINGNCEMLLSKREAGDPAFVEIKQIQNHSQRAASLVKQLLAFSRQQTLNKKVVQVTDRLLEATQLVDRLLGERIRLRFQHGRGLWPVKIDAAEFDRVIMNLCVNARDAMPEGGDIIIRTRNVPTAEIPSFGKEILSTAPADYVLIEVIDSGFGIPPEILPKIFQPFFTTKLPSEGTGLGLAGVYGIVKQMDGFIFADSEPGKGATFRIFLPRVAEAVEEKKPERTDTAPQRDLSGKGAILLVEDETPVRMLAKRALEVRGYHVIDAGSGEAALKIIENQDQPIDLVISDVVMPNMDGPSLLRHIRTSRPDVKVIFMSGYAEEAFRKSLRGDEDFLFIAKPFSLKDLALKVKQTLTAHAA